MKKSLLIPLTVAAALGTAGLAIGTTTNVFSSPAVVQAATIGNVYVFGDQADVYNTPNGTIVRTLPTGSGWQYSATQTDSSDTHWYQVAPSQWINDKQAVTAINPGSIRNETGVVVVKTASAIVWSTPNMHKSGRTLPNGSTWKYSRTFTDTFGMTWYRVSPTEWVHTDEVGLQVSKVQQVINAAKHQLGVPYVYGGTTPNGFDCSGLVQYVFKQIGVNLPRVSQEQSKVGTYVSVNALQPGDLVFWGGVGTATHVGIYIGNGNYIHAPEQGENVKISSIQYYRPDFGRRVL